MEWLIAVLAFLSSFTGHIERNEDYVAREMAVLTGVPVIPEYRYAIRSAPNYRSYVDEDTIFLARPRFNEFRHELVHIRFAHMQEYDSPYHEAIAEYIARRLGDLNHPYQRLANYPLTPLVCGGHIPQQGVINGLQGGDNTWYAYQVWNLVIQQQRKGEVAVTKEEFYAPTPMALWFEAYRAVCIK